MAQHVKVLNNKSNWKTSLQTISKLLLRFRLISIVQVSTICFLIIRFLGNTEAVAQPARPKRIHFVEKSCSISATDST